MLLCSRQLTRGVHFLQCYSQMGHRFEGLLPGSRRHLHVSTAPCPTPTPPPGHMRNLTALAPAFQLSPEVPGLRHRVPLRCRWREEGGFPGPSQEIPASSACLRDPSSLPKAEPGVFTSGPCSRQPRASLPGMPSAPSSPTHCSQLPLPELWAPPRPPHSPFARALHCLERFLFCLILSDFFKIQPHPSTSLEAFPG